MTEQGRTVETRSSIVASGRNRLLFVCNDQLLTMGWHVAWSSFASTHPPPGSVLVNYSWTSSVPRLLHVIALHLLATLYLRLYYLSRLVDFVATWLVIAISTQAYRTLQQTEGGARLSHWIGSIGVLWLPVLSRSTPYLLESYLSQHAPWACRSPRINTPPPPPAAIPILIG
jgi:hypothetical protein